MRYLTGNWSFDPFLILAAVAVIGNEIGLARMSRLSFPQDSRHRRLRSLLFYAGLVTCVLAVASPLDYWGGRYFFVQTGQTLLLAFGGPSLIVAGAPWRPIRYALPGRLRPDPAQALLAEPRSGRGWAAARRVARPWLVVAVFNLVLIAWYLRGPFQLGATNRLAHIWLLHVSLVTAGILFWFNFIGSPPLRARLSPAAKLVAVLVTNQTVSLLTMWMTILSRQSWYPVYSNVPGVSLNPLVDQQTGAAALFACVDFWAGLSFIVIVWRMMRDDGGLESAIDRLLGRGQRLASDERLDG
jgi:cytochrome c oxidase assembly factor CtaG